MPPDAFSTTSLRRLRTRSDVALRALAGRGDSGAFAAVLGGSPTRPAGLVPTRALDGHGLRDAVGAAHSIEGRHSVMVALAQPALRLGTIAALEHGGFDVIAQAATGARATRVAIARHPDTCVLDSSMPGGGIHAARAITTAIPGTGVLVLTEEVSAEEMRAALRAGASGYLPTSTDPKRLCAAVQSVLAGDAAVPRSLMLSLIGEIPEAPRGQQPTVVGGRAVLLTRRESQVVERLRLGMDTRDIASALGISVVTVRRHLSGALRKLGARDRSAALGLLGQRGAQR